MTYAKGQTPQRQQGQNAQGQRGPNGQGRFGNGNGQGRPVVGEIIAKDEKSITVKMQDGSTKIVLIAGSTTVSKTSDASTNDLTVGQRVGVFGMQNSDGSLSAQNIQLNPMFRFGSPNPAGSPRSQKE